MKRYKNALCLAAMLLSLTSPVLAAVNQASPVSEFTHYKIGVFLKAEGLTFSKPNTEEQGFHIHGKISNQYNFLGVKTFKYAEPYEIFLWKIIGMVEIAQEELS